MSYLITAEGNHHVVHLMQAKNLIAKDIPVFTYSAEGDLITEFPYIQEGVVEGSPGSIVSLSTCFGISGVLQTGDLRYEIEPVENSSTFQHLIYRRVLEGSSRRLCQVPEEHKDHLAEDGELANGSRKILVIEEVPGLQILPVPTRHLDLALITNEELFKVNNYNETLVLHLFISIRNLLNTVYKHMKLQTIVIAVEMWTRTDQAMTARSLARTLQVFAAWCQRDAIGHINYDHIQLLLSCLAFSNCTMGEYYNEVIRKNLPCLLNIPSLKPFLLELCGNGVLEKEEECDCGSDEACLQDGCCFSSSCLLAPGAACYRGECCHKRQFQPAGKICREDRSVCDLPECCNGSSGTCPMDVKEDRSPCSDKDRCYDGHGHSHEAQCKALFGRATHCAPLSCFREVNVRGDRCGNCGWNGTYYTKCLEE
ncbi:LOW QUALITY PROTEIN: disintegrin and metalloproteinase domain-containing protein 9-like [Cariama cristata]